MSLYDSSVNSGNRGSARAKISTPITNTRESSTARLWQPRSRHPRLWHLGLLRREHTITLSPEATRHARSVLRLRAGDRLRLFNEQHGEWLAEIKRWGSHDGEALCQERLRSPSEASIEKIGPRLYFSPIRPHRMALLLAGAVELGVATLLPYRSSYTTARFSRARAQRMVIAAVEQSERLCCPTVEAEQRLQPNILTQESLLLFCAEQGAIHSLAKAISLYGIEKRVKNRSRQNVAILVGPEGGFSQQEHAMLRACPQVVPVSLGKRVLRCETAALAVIACWQALAGDWQGDA